MTLNRKLLLKLVKQKEGISSCLRDDYILFIIDAVIHELENVHGIVLDQNNLTHSLFVVDYSHFRYKNNNETAMSRHLQFRLHNMILMYRGDKDVVEQ